MRHLWRPLYALALSVVLTGCVLVPFIQAFHESGATSGDRMALLQPQAKKFSDAMMMGNKSLALAVVKPENRPTVVKQLRDKNEEERVVEAKVDDVQFQEDAWKATVTLKVKYYKVPFYIVESRYEEQQWEFSLSDGWQLREMSLVEG